MDLDDTGDEQFLRKIHEMNKNISFMILSRYLAHEIANPITALSINNDYLQAISVEDPKLEVVAEVTDANKSVLGDLKETIEKIRFLSTDTSEYSQNITLGRLSQIKYFEDLNYFNLFQYQNRFITLLDLVILDFINSVRKECASSHFITSLEDTQIDLIGDITFTDPAVFEQFLHPTIRSIMEFSLSTKIYTLSKLSQYFDLPLLVDFTSANLLHIKFSLEP